MSFKLDVVRNQVQQRFCIETRPDPCGMVVFGASGDLAERKLFPSLYHLRKIGLLPKKFYVVGAGRTHMTDESFRGKVELSLEKQGISAAGSDLSEFLSSFYYYTADYADGGAYKALAGLLARLDARHETRGNHIFYLSLPPSLYVPVTQNLGLAGLAAQKNGSGQGWSRLLIEKPFGHNLATAQHLTQEIQKFFTEQQTYRIDHYLGKETVQSIMVLRFANVMFEPIWNKTFVDHVQITAAESLGVEHRAGYYEEAGVIRDMFQNHLLQLLCITAMEPPVSFSANRVRDEKSKVLRTVRPFNHDMDRFAVRGQYGPGAVGGLPVAGYRQEKNVKPDSNTETFAAMKLFVDNWRWRGVPFYLRSGKRMGKRLTEIAVHFKRVPHSIFEPLKPEDLEPNVLLIRIQPEEGISLTFETKQPGPKLCMSSVTMDFSYETSFGEPPEAYERLFLDAMAGDQTLFNRSDWVDLSWGLLEPLLEHWKKPAAFPNYAAGSSGPEAADALLAESGHRWRDL